MMPGKELTTGRETGANITMADPKVGEDGRIAPYLVDALATSLTSMFR
jgi:hypothetical protein